MKINSYEGLLGKTGALRPGGADSSNLKSVGAKPDATGGAGQSTEDIVDISPQTGLQKMSVSAESMMAEFKTALVQTIPGYQGGSSMGDLNSLSGTPLDTFINTRFAETTPESKQEFMSYFDSLSRTSNGLVSSKVVTQAFGNSDGFASMISTISNSLARYL